LEASRRLGDHWKLEFNSCLLLNAEEDTLLNFLRDDDFIQLTLMYYF